MNARNSILMVSCAFAMIAFILMINGVSDVIAEDPPTDAISNDGWSDGISIDMKGDTNKAPKMYENEDGTISVVWSTFQGHAHWNGEYSFKTQVKFAKMDEKGRLLQEERVLLDAWMNGSMRVVEAYSDGVNGHLLVIELYNEVYHEVTGFRLLHIDESGAPTSDPEDIPLNASDLGVNNWTFARDELGYIHFFYTIDGRTIISYIRFDGHGSIDVGPKKLVGSHDIDNLNALVYKDTIYLVYNALGTDSEDFDVNITRIDRAGSYAYDTKQLVNDTLIPKDILIDDRSYITRFLVPLLVPVQTHTVYQVSFDEGGNKVTKLRWSTFEDKYEYKIGQSEFYIDYFGRLNFVFEGVKVGFFIKPYSTINHVMITDQGKNIDHSLTGLYKFPNREDFDITFKDDGSMRLIWSFRSLNYTFKGRCTGYPGNDYLEKEHPLFSDKQWDIGYSYLVPYLDLSLGLVEVEGPGEFEDDQYITPSGEPINFTLEIKNIGIVEAYAPIIDILLNGSKYQTFDPINDMLPSDLIKLKVGSFPPSGAHTLTFVVKVSGAEYLLEDNSEDLSIVVLDEPDGILELDKVQTYRKDPIEVDAGPWSTRFDPLKYIIDWGDGETTNWTTRTQFYHSYDKIGEFAISLIVKDRFARTSDAVVENVTIVNRAPIPMIEMLTREDNYIMGQEIQFDASNSSDPDGDVLRFEWVIMNGVYGEISNLGPYLSLKPLKGPVEVQMIVTDRYGMASTLKANFDMAYRPRAVLYVPTVPMDRHHIYNFSGIRSTPSGELEYQFDMGDNTRSPWLALPFFDHQFERFGHHIVSLRVRDRDGIESDWDRVGIMIENIDPVAELTVNNLEVGCNDPVIFSVYNVWDPDGYVWKIIASFDGVDTYPSVRGNFSIYRTYKTPGNKTFRLQVLDNNGGNLTLEIRGIKVINRMPISKISTLPKYFYTKQEEVTFDGSGSTDPDGEIVVKYWTIEGKTYKGDRIEHFFSKAGKYQVNLTVVDEFGAQSSSSTSVSIWEPDPIMEKTGGSMDLDTGISLIFLVLAISFFLLGYKVKNDGLKRV